MKMNKSLTAVAVAGALTVPATAAHAQPEGWYGFIGIGIETASIDTTFVPGLGAPVFATATDDQMSLADIGQSRFGWGGSEDLGNGLSADYQFEWGLTGGSGVQTAGTLQNRLSWVGLSGDFGSVKIGQQWGALYEYLGWNQFKAAGHGGATWYWLTGPLRDNSYGLRVSNAVSYTYGAGGYGNDPFSFTVQGTIGNDTTSENDLIAGSTFTTTGGTSTAGLADDDADDLDSITVAAKAVIDDFEIIGVYVQENQVQMGAVDVSTGGTVTAEGSDPSLFGLGVAYYGVDNLGLHLNYIQADYDIGDDDEPSIINFLATYDFGDGLSGMLGYGVGDGDDGADDMDTVFLQLSQALSARTRIDFEYEQVSMDDDVVDGNGDMSVLGAYLYHTF